MSAEQNCAVCGARLLPGDQFCARCGTAHDQVSPSCIEGPTVSVWEQVYEGQLCKTTPWGARTSETRHACWPAAAHPMLAPQAFET